jgi:ribonuclease HI
LFHKAAEDGTLDGIQICPNAPKINHMFFADDSIIFIKVNEASALKLQSILRLYEGASGQMINKEKSAVMFSKGTSNAAKRRFLSVLEISAEAYNERYLGLPIYLGRSKSKAFGFLLEKVWKKIQGWKERFLSKAGKEILVKAVAQAIPIFAMSCFDLTKTFCDDLSSMVCRYWWNNQDEERHHWLSWELLTKPKSEGGLGFRDPHIFNMAMLARQGWRLLLNPDSLCGRLLKAKYFPECSILDASPKPDISYTWRSILRGVALLKEGLIWRVGDGTNVKIWEDPWLPIGETRRPRTGPGHSEILSVSELLNPLTGGWDETLISALFAPEDAKTILSIGLGDDPEDRPAWHFDPKGAFSVKSAYKVGVTSRDRKKGRDAACSRAATENSVVKFRWNNIWHLNAPNKLKMFVWRVAHNSLAIRMKIHKLGVDLDTRCPICNRLDEDGGHVFLKCKRVKECWNNLGLSETREKLLACNSAHAMLETLWTCNEESKMKALVLMWEWWGVRNKANAGEMVRSAAEVCHSVERHMMDFQSIRPPRKPPKPPNILKWEKPKENMVKVNFDGAFNKVSGTGGWGFIIRNHRGEFVAAGAGKVGILRDTLHAETIACLAAVDGATNLGADRITFESDSLNLVQALRSNGYNRSAIGTLVMEARRKCMANFNSFDFSFCRWACNSAAHELAQFGVKSEMSDYFWVDSAPNCVTNFVASDLAEPVE